MSRDVQARRDAEFAAATTPAEVASLQRKWVSEDEARLLVESDQARELCDLRDALTDAKARIYRLERMLLTPDGKGISEHIIAPIGEVVGRVRKEIMAEIPRFSGVHEAGRTYPKNSLVVKGGGLWISLTKTTDPPGNTAWQLVTKSGEVR